MLLLLGCERQQPGTEESPGAKPTPAPKIASPPGVSGVVPGPYVQPAHPHLIADTETMPLEVRTYCGLCHAAPHPEVLTKGRWPKKLNLMFELLKEKEVPVTEAGRQVCYDYYVGNSPDEFEVLPEDDSSHQRFFTKYATGHPVTDFAEADWKTWPKITHVKVVDLDRDGRNDVLVSDAQYDMLSWIHFTDGRWLETPIAGLRTPLPGFKAPARTEVFDFEGDGDMDILVAVLGQLRPSDDEIGQVVLLINDGAMRFKAITMLQEMPRLADVRPADLDGDGDWDYVFAMFGWYRTGEVAWMEQTGGDFNPVYTISVKSGCTHVPVGDIDGDGRTDIVALVTQEFEEIIVYRNLGDGRFEETVIFEALNPAFGSSGIELVDLDQDDDLDILYTNGDGFDGTDAKPYHGVQWLENKGGLEFAYHDLTRFYGAYSADAVDMDGDGDLDVVAANCFMSSAHKYWENLPRHGMIWLENDGHQRFRRHAITEDPSHLITTDVGDLDGDGRPDIVGGGMHVFPPFPPAEKVGRVSLWVNKLPQRSRAGRPQSGGQ